MLYGSAMELWETLEYDLSEERNFSYKDLSLDEIIHHLAVFISRLWQIHLFNEGNTRTTAVFFIKYLRTLGFKVTNDIFAQNAWYFWNSLVRANYNDLKTVFMKRQNTLNYSSVSSYLTKNIRSITEQCTLTTPFKR